MIRGEWKNLLKHKFLLLVVIVVALVPAIYSNVFLGSMWKPYNSIENLPVAIINKDKGAITEGKSIDIGADLVKKLKEKNPLDLHFPSSEKEAVADLKKGNYYMVLVLEDDFSQNASKILKSSPLPMKLDYYTNPGLNYISTKITDSAVKDIQKEIIKNVQSTYIGLLFDNMHEMKTGFTKLKEGSKGLYAGTGKLVEGQQGLNEGLTSLGLSIKKYSDGADDYYKGLTKYLGAISSLKTGGVELSSKSKDLIKGTNTYIKGVAEGGQTLVDGAGKLGAGVDKLGGSLPSKKDIQEINSAHLSISKGLEGLELGIDELKGHTTTLAQSLTSLKSVSGQLRQATTSISLRVDALIEDMVLNVEESKRAGLREELKQKFAALNLGTIEQGIGQLDGGLEGTSRLSQGIDGDEGLGRLSLGLSSLSNEYTNKLLPNQQTLNNGYNFLREGIYEKDGLKAGVSAYEEGVKNYASIVKASGESYKKGVLSYVNGTDKVVAGVSSLSNNSGAISEGAKKLTTGSKAIYKGSGKLNDGSLKLVKASGEVNKGTKTISDSLREASDRLNIYSFDKKNAQALTEPIQIKTEATSVIVNNGHAMAPYMMTISLFVGGLALCLVYPFNRDRDRSTNPFKWWGAKASILGLESLLQGGILVTTLIVFLGFSPIFKQEVIIMAIITSFAFLSLIGFLVINFGLVGKFLAMIVLVLQLGTSEGTYPLALSSSIYSKISPFMPATYAISGFKEAISIDGHIGFYVFVLLAFTLLFNLLSIGSIYLIKKKAR